MTLETKKRKVLFTAADGSVVRVVVELEGNNTLNPPKFVQFRGKLYETTGSGLTCNFYHEVEERFQIVKDCKEYTRQEFFALD